MIINRYRANSLKSAIEKAKADLGSDAKVIHVRQLEKASAHDIPENIEIIAAVDNDDEMENINNVYNTHKLNSSDSPEKSNVNIYKKQQGISSKDFQEKIQNVNNKKANRNSGSILLQKLEKCCNRHCVNADITFEIMSMLNTSANGFAGATSYKECLSRFINNKLSMSGGLDGTKKASIMIGPTGVGKTTTLAKLAAHYHFYREKSVGLITIDAYRIAAIEQLKTYAQIMSIPLRTALTPDELRTCIGEFSHMDLILVDTPGRSQFDEESLHVLQDFLEAAQPADTHLLIAASMKEGDIDKVLENFAPAYVQQIIFTKIDETSTFGSLLNVGTKAGKPISYFTNGQNVPDDIDTAKTD
ncbi:flagellar biosynthesis protein FlhF, partial [Candidatus Poribacteria bacterium]|nr:flagellar biosynthesis protein FlhF [Candidatus Poribacteria bacterium]